MLNKKISLNKAINTLSDDTSRLLFTWTIAHLDVEGRVPGDPCILKAWVVPRLTHITEEMVRECIHEWHNKDLIIWYEANDDLWIQFPEFDKNQPNLRKDREEPSNIPAPEEGRIIEENMQESCRSDAGATQEELPVKRREEKRSKEKKNLPAKPANEPQWDDLEKNIEDACLSQLNDPSQQYDYGKERKHVKQIGQRARNKDSPEEFIKQIFETLYRLKREGDNFWVKQPFLPSVINSKGIWPRILEEMGRGDEVEKQLEEMGV
jgi:hypothetical protein